jgi:hypothetical protein
LCAALCRPRPGPWPEHRPFHLPVSSLSGYTLPLRQVRRSPSPGRARWVRLDRGTDRRRLPDVGGSDATTQHPGRRSRRPHEDVEKVLRPDVGKRVEPNRGHSSFQSPIAKVGLGACSVRPGS